MKFALIALDQGFKPIPTPKIKNGIKITFEISKYFCNLKHINSMRDKLYLG
jgi:hypothetical protein